MIRRLNAFFAPVFLFMIAGTPFTFASPVSDNFTAQTLNTKIWRIVDPVGDSSVAIVDGTMRISVAEGSEHDMWITGNNAARVVQSVSNDARAIETRFLSTVEKRFQMQGILIEEDEKNFLRFDIGSDGGKRVRIFVASFSNGAPTVIQDKFVQPAENYYLRVTRTGIEWDFSVSFDGSEWMSAAKLERELLSNQVGVFAGNAKNSESPAFTAIVDYFVVETAAVTSDDS